VGVSRGGLYCYNWASQNPEKVACIYGDAPVCDVKSWPMGEGHVYGLDDSTLLVEFMGKHCLEAIAEEKSAK